MSSALTADSAHDEACRGQAIEVSAGVAAYALAAVLVISGALAAKQIVFAKIASRDACTVHLPYARAWAEGRLADAQHPATPVLYPAVVGGLSRIVQVGRDPLDFAGRLISAVCVLGLVVCVYSIGAALFSRRVGITAAALTGFNPFIIRYGANVGPEMLYGLLVVLMLRLLVSYQRRQRITTAAGIGLCAAVAALTRSEGIVFPVLAVVVMFAIHLAASPRRWARGVVCLSVVVAVTGLTWLPRLIFVYGRTGYPLLDVRMVSLFLPDDRVDPDWWRTPHQRARVAFPTAEKPQRPYPDTWLKRRSLVEGLKEAMESLLLVFGPATWAFAVFWFAGRKSPSSARGSQVIVASVILAEIAMVARVGVNSRLVSTVAAPAQLWGALGMIVLAERLRGRKGLLGRFGQSIPMQMVGLAALLAGLACWSLLGSNINSRDAEIRTLGELVRQRGPGKTLLGEVDQLAYYADGDVVLGAFLSKSAEGLSGDEIRRLCRDYEVDYIVFRSKSRWARWLMERSLAGDLPEGAVVRAAAGAEDVAYLIDARRLFPQERPSAE